MQKIWLGTRKLEWLQAIQTIRSALEIGYRHIDTARIYNNESEVWTAIKDSQIPREQLHITTKVWFDYVPNYQQHQFKAEDFSYTKLEERFEASLQALRTEYLDQVLLHRPTTLENDLKTFEKLLKLKKEWKILQLWVSNFPLWYLKEFREYFGDEISCNQIEFHPCLSNPELQIFAKEKNLTLQAYSPLGHGKILKNPILLAIAEKHNVPPAQVCIARVLQQNLLPLPKASTPSRLLENRNAQNITLDSEDLEKIDQLPKHYRYCNPPFAPNWD